MSKLNTAKKLEETCEVTTYITGESGKHYTIFTNEVETGNPDDMVWITTVETSEIIEVHSRDRFSHAVEMHHSMIAKYKKL